MRSPRRIRFRRLARQADRCGSSAPVTPVSVACLAFLAAVVVFSCDFLPHSRRDASFALLSSFPSSSLPLFARAATAEHSAGVARPSLSLSGSSKEGAAGRSPQPCLSSACEEAALVASDEEHLHALLPSRALASSASSSLSLPDSPPAAAASRRLKAADVNSASSMKSIKDLSNPLDVLGVFIIGIASIIAVAAGAGGGAIYVPVMILVMGFTVYEATATSQALMFGGSLAGTCLNLFRRHPRFDRPAIDLDLVLLMGPMQIAGATYGLVINRCCPVYVIVAALVVLLLATAYKTSRQMLRLKRESKETRALLATRSGSVCEALEEEQQEEEQARHYRAASAPSSPREGSRGEAAHAEECDTAGAARSGESRAEAGGGDVEAGNAACIEMTGVGGGAHPQASAEAREASGEAIRDENTDNVDRDGDVAIAGEGGAAAAKASAQPSGAFSLAAALRGHSPQKWLVMFIIYAINLAFTIVKGGRQTPWDLVRFCGPSYWAVYVSAAVFLMTSSYFCAIYLWRRDEKAKERKRALGLPIGGEAGADKAAGELEYSFQNVHLLLLVSLTAGIMAGVVGIGGGLVLGPFLLTNGVPPAVTTSVNTTLILFTSSSAAAISIASATAPWDYCLLLFGVCFFTTLIGKAFVDRLVKRYHADYILVVLLLVIMFGSVVCTVISGVLTIKKGDPVDMSFKAPC
ncbi:hypothetical protein BESB_033220 [Besnoitia besnoiti]|uniref:Sulfite exporter TauE/SafE protein n=1 Tax=Besnoitia besnoiti TaxID=94643 RepID=A0A2A9LZ50_BESBE|nr:uncharacterized protein BESB_033220 [Besnoitia besnoiti]PFH31049.1 hypothetical protein BESB_033220 [Besnoitia besnoiti]